MNKRAEQVTLMAEIYSSASHVLAWLGPPSHDSNLAMNLLHRIADSIDVDWRSFDIRPKESSFTREIAMSNTYTRLLCDLNFPLPWDGPEARTLESLFWRPWFERLWIRQESPSDARALFSYAAAPQSTGSCSSALHSC